MENNQLQEFDEAFINRCVNSGMSVYETQRALFESPERKAIIDALVKTEATKTNVVMIVQKDDPILNHINPTEGICLESNTSAK